MNLGDTGLAHSAGGPAWPDDVDSEGLATKNGCLGDAPGGWPSKASLSIAFAVSNGWVQSFAKPCKPPATGRPRVLGASTATGRPRVLGADADMALRKFPALREPVRLGATKDDATPTAATGSLPATELHADDEPNDGRGLRPGVNGRMDASPRVAATDVP